MGTTMISMPNCASHLMLDNQAKLSHIGPLHCHADNLTPSYPHNPREVPFIHSTFPSDMPSRATGKRTWSQAHGDNRHKFPLRTPEVPTETRAATTIPSDHVRLMSTQHGAIEVPWQTFWMALLKMFENQNNSDLQTKFCQGR